MKLDKASQSALLRLGEVDLEIAHIKQEITKHIESQELVDLRAKQSELAGALIASRTILENYESAQRRADDDLHLVEERIRKDRERLSQSSSPKDVIGLQSEIDSLVRRKSDLEDAELELLAELEQAKAAMDVVASEKNSNTAMLEALQESIQEKIDELKTKGRKLTADREILVSKISEEVLKKYTALSARQVAVGKIENRSCTSCRMGLTANVIDNINDLVEDELGVCPECQAFIVR
jgi:predicted  nucleic acid-binding Zn-ribbon protein